MRKTVEMIAVFDTDGKPSPLRFRLLNNSQQLETIKIDKIICKEVNNLAGNRMIKYACQCQSQAELKTLELRYELDTCKWYLY